MEHQLCDEHGEHVFWGFSLVGFVYFLSWRYFWSTECVDMRVSTTVSTTTTVAFNITTTAVTIVGSRR